MTPPNSPDPAGVVRPTALRFAIRFSDNSGDEIAVRFDEHDKYDAGKAVIERFGDDLVVPPERLDWLISALIAVRDHLRAAQKGASDERC